MGSFVSRNKDDSVIKHEEDKYAEGAEVSSARMKQKRKQTVVSQAIMQRINMAIMRRRTDHTTVPMNKIILQFPLINQCFINIRKAFDDFDTDGSQTIEYSELKAAMNELGVHDIKDEVLREIFDESDVRNSGKLSFKEFLVALALIYLLELIPIKRVVSNIEPSSPKEQKSTPAVRESIKMEMAAYNARVLESELEGDKEAVTPSRFRSNSIRPNLPENEELLEEVGRPVQKGSNLFDEHTKLQKCFDMITDAYIQFDKQGTGSIKKDDLEAIVNKKNALKTQHSMRKDTKRVKKDKKEKKEKHEKEGIDPVTEFLTKERFHELDTRAGEYITFREFLFAFESWVGMEEE